MTAQYRLQRLFAAAFASFVAVAPLIALASAADGETPYAIFVSSEAVVRGDSETTEAEAAWVVPVHNGLAPSVIAIPLVSSDLDAKSNEMFLSKSDRKQNDPFGAIFHTGWSIFAVMAGKAMDTYPAAARSNVEKSISGSGASAGAPICWRFSIWAGRVGTSIWLVSWGRMPKSPGRSVSPIFVPRFLSALASDTLCRFYDYCLEKLPLRLASAAGLRIKQS